MLAFLVGRGKSNAEIAERLVLSPLTKAHVARLFSAHVSRLAPGSPQGR